MMKKNLVFLVVLVLLVFAAGCARQGYPSGGPKDTDAPKALDTKPLNESRNFAERQFYIQFDEYVTLKNAEQNVIISPPMDPKPEFTTKGRGVLVKIKDTLQPGTTYLFQFKEAIADFTEGNLLPSFEYVFSTGDAMDTMMVAGRVLNARDGKPWSETVTVLAYSGDDTVVSRVTRADKNGRFAFHYIPAGSYRIVALEDKNRNLKIEDGEPVAWVEQPVVATDSIDSLSVVAMRISAPERRKQRVVKSEMPVKGRIVIATAAPMVQPTISGLQAEQHLSANGDTLTLWCVNPQSDSAVIVLSDTDLQDTIKVRYKAPKKPRHGSAPQAEPLMKTLCSGQEAYYDDLRLAFTNPIVSQSDSLQVRLMSLKDSTLVPCSLTLDSTRLGDRLDAKLNADEDYSVVIPAGMFTDMYGTATDSMRFSMKPKDYAILTMHIVAPEGSLVVELLDTKDTVLMRRTLDGSGTLRFDHIAGGDYRLRAVMDADGNGRWTPGDYALRRQPEEFVLFGKTLKLRERWEMEEKWDIVNGEPVTEKEKL